MGWNLVSAADWPQWRGPRRDAVSTETGLLQTWPDGGPELAWKTNGLGTGYSSVVVGAGRLFTTGRHGSDVIVTALDVQTTKPIWTRKIGETTKNPSSTPTLDGNSLYALDPDGDLACLKAESGEIVWTKSFAQDFSGQMMSARGNGESPLIDGDHLICTPGGKDAFMVAMNKLTGDVIWKTKVPEIGPAGKDGASFSSIVVSNGAGVRQYVQLVGRGLVSVAADDGRVLWSYNEIANDSANIPTPIAHGDYVFGSNGYSAGSVLLKLVPDNDSGSRQKGVKAEVVYSLTASQLQNHHGGVVRVGNDLFTGHGNNNGLPTCIDFLTGKIFWKRRGPGVGSAAIVYADGQLIFRYQNGLVALIEASNRGYQLNGTLEIPGAGGDSWSHPVVANGRLYLREQDALYVYDLRNESGTGPKETPSATSTESNPAFISLKKIGISFQQYPSQALAKTVPTAANKPRSLYDYAIQSDEKESSKQAWIVTIPDKQLSPEGLLSKELLSSLSEIPGPLILSVAGTRLSNAGLQQLQSLHPVGLNFELCNQLTDEGFERLGDFQSLRALDLTGTSISPPGIKGIASHPGLLALDLELCDGIKDAACETLGTMSQLRMLVLKKSGFERPGITDAGLQKLGGLVRLEALSLYGNSVTDAGLIGLHPFKKLRDLNLSLLNLHDGGIEQLMPLKSLEHLELLYSEGFAGPTLTDSTVGSLESLIELKTLNLTGSGVTDQGLERLQTLKMLQSLQLVRTKVTDDGVHKFRQALPKCEVVR